MKVFNITTTTTTDLVDKGDSNLHEGSINQISIKSAYKVLGC